MRWLGGLWRIVALPSIGERHVVMHELDQLDLLDNAKLDLA